MRALVEQLFARLRAGAHERVLRRLAEHEDPSVAGAVLRAMEAEAVAPPVSPARRPWAIVDVHSGDVLERHRSRSEARTARDGIVRDRALEDGIVAVRRVGA